ncbi:hypothetical protein [Streptomyces sp. NPDC001876]|uniref:hypothetical protein n=1 Tax=Streptomyces sp. NPDC001876 TaxID=3154402 RepID=UPI00331D4228
MTTPTETVRDVLRDTESYLSALHGSVARHDQLGANLTCGGCQLRDRVTVARRILGTTEQADTETAPVVDRLCDQVQQRIGGDTCPLCAEYLALKQRAESREAAARPLLKPEDRTEPTYQERIAAALFEQHIRIPWAMAYPDDVEGYLADAGAFLAIRDAEMMELRRLAAEAQQPTEIERTLGHADDGEWHDVTGQPEPALNASQFVAGLIHTLNSPDATDRTPSAEETH